jgi:hypothetical protein
MNPEYKQVRFLVSPSAEIPERFGIVTAYNPNGIDADEAQNLTATENLRRQLLNEHFKFFKVTGCSPDLRHQEPGFGIASDNHEAIIVLGRAWEQQAVFWVQDGIVHLVPCEHGETVMVGEWSALARPPG